MVNFYGEIGNVIKNLREQRRMSKKQLAEGICSPSYISRIENGDRCPTSVILRQLANKLGIAPEELFRTIESPTSLEIKKLIDTLLQHVERNDFMSIASIIAKNEKYIQMASHYDLQLITALKLFSNAVLEKDFSKGAKQLESILYKTYNQSCCPTDIELGIMGAVAHLMILDGRLEEAYAFLIKFEKHIDNVYSVFTYEAVPRYYITLTLAGMDFIPVEDSFRYIQSAIDYCKENNVHAFLRDIYVVKAELYLKGGDRKNYSLWIDKAVQLHELIKYSDDDYFETFLRSRKNRHKV